MTNRTYPKVKRKVSVSYPNPTLTEASHGSETRIENIMRKYSETGVITHTARYRASYGDFLSAPDYQEAQNRIAEAQQMFDEIPAAIRQKFSNDPGQFIDFMQNPENIESIEALGFDASHLRGNVELDSNPVEKPTEAPSSGGDEDAAQQPEAAPE